MHMYVIVPGCVAWLKLRLHLELLHTHAMKSFLALRALRYHCIVLPFEQLVFVIVGICVVLQAALCQRQQQLKLACSTLRYKCRRI